MDLKQFLVTLAVSGLLLNAFAPYTLAATDLQEGAKPVAEANIAIDAKKLQVAKDLTDWLNYTLQEKKILVAVVGRQGSPQTKKQDKTGMGHAGLAVYDPRAKSWIIYNLLNTTTGSQPKGEIWRTAPLDFFYAQKGYEKDALILIPDTVTQQRMYEAILNGNYQRLFYTDDYNLLSIYDSPHSLNCNKWLLMNIAAARIDEYDPVKVLNAIHEGFKPAKVNLNFIERQMAQKKPNIRWDELPANGPYETVTVESFYRSDLFTEMLFFSGRQLQ